MRGPGVLAALGLLYAAPAFGLAAGADHAELEFWKGLNFLIILGVIVWAARKYGRPFFQGRTREIRRQMVEAEEVRAEADRRTAEVEARLANLGSEIEALRREALEQQRAESERFSRRMAAEMEKIGAHAEAEIEAAGRQARLELRRYTAKLAMGLAERRIRERMTPAVQNELLDSFVQAVGAPAPRAQAR